MALVEDILKEFNTKVQALNNSIISLKRERDDVLDKATNPPETFRACVLSDTPTEYGFFAVTDNYVGEDKPDSLKDKLFKVRCISLSDKDKQLIAKIEEKERQKAQLKTELEFTLRQMGFDSDKAAQAAATAYTSANEATEAAEKRKLTLTIAFVSLFAVSIIAVVFYIIRQIKKSKQKSNE